MGDGLTRQETYPPKKQLIKPKNDVDLNFNIRGNKKPEESNKAENCRFLPLVTPIPNEFPLLRSTINSARCTDREYVI